jgi:hypothetical protein
MGTRADFYVGIDENSEWLGSIAYDGFPNKWGHPYKLLKVKTEKTYRKKVKEIIKNNIEYGAVFPENGWPWPWEDSSITDYSYYFYNGKVYHTDTEHTENDNYVNVIVPHIEGWTIGSGLRAHPKNVTHGGFMILGI